MPFQIVCSPIFSVPALRLKYPRIRNDIIHLESLQTVGAIRWDKVAWVLATQKTKRTLRKQLTIIYCSMFRLHTVARERERERERGRERKKKRERKKEGEKERERGREREGEKEKGREREIERERERERRERKRERKKERERKGERICKGL